MFWLLLDNEKGKKLNVWMETLRTDLPDSKFSGLANKIKRRSGEIQFHSLLSEIEVLSYYSAKGYASRYEPLKGDLQLSLNGVEVFLEIAKLFSSKEENRIDSLAELVWAGLDNLDANRYLIIFGITPAFSKSDVELFTEFVNGALTQRFERLPSERLDFEYGKAWIIVLSPSENGRGRVVGKFVGMMEKRTASRLKGKILDQIAQLPQNKLNVVVYNISHFFAHLEDIEVAFYGHPGKKNGVVHEEAGKQCSAIIAFEDFNYDKRSIYLNPKAKLPIGQETLGKL